MLMRCFYVSAIADGLTDVQVQVILGEAQVNNRRLDVTGMLAQSDGHFAQVLEGRADAVGAPMERIGRDRRHHDVRVLLNEPIVRRQFSHWAMVLLRRDDCAERMRQLHAEGCTDAEHAQRLIDTLMASVG